MSLSIEALLSPAEYHARASQGFAGQGCVVFDVLRATSVMITGLANGAVGFVPVAEISEALAQRRLSPEIILAGERDGLRIRAQQSGGVDFDLGNSPREYLPARVGNRTIVTTTTNGTRAIQSCRGAAAVVIGSFLNLTATTDWILQQSFPKLVLVCAGTGNDLAFEDVLGAGALCDQLIRQKSDCQLDDAATLAYCAYRAVAGDLVAAVGSTTNGRRLIANPDLCKDVAWCVRRDECDFVGALGEDGVVRRLTN